MTAAARLVRSFATLPTPHPGNARRLQKWITTARAASLPHLHAFTRGLDLDSQAATAAHTLTHHNGRTEGVNTKMIKRQMYGRARFALLRHRILLGLRHKPSPPKVRQSRYRHPQVAGAGQKADFADSYDLYHTMEAFFSWYPNGGRP